MGQKVSPIGLRVGIIRDWDSTWFAEKDYAKFLHEDIAIREFLNKRLKNASISLIKIDRRSKETVEISISTAKPGIVIGKGGSDIETLRYELTKMTNKKVFVNIQEIKNPDLDAKLVAENIARQLENRASFRTVQKRAIQRVIRSGAQGVKTAVSGRLGGADMARTEGYSEGNVPLHTLRADVDYAHEEANTTYGKMGVKVWIYRGEILPQKKNRDAKGGK